MIKNVRLSDGTEPEMMIRILTLGNISVGKTSIILRYLNDTFKEDHKMTIGIDMQTINVEYYNHIAQLIFWDSAGQERFQSMTKNYYKNSDVLLLIFDVMDNKSFSQLETWLNGIIENKVQHALVYLIANKIDYGSRRLISTHQGEILAERYNIPYYEVSALSGYNIDKLFEDIVSEIVKNKYVLSCDTNSIRLSVSTCVSKKKKKEDCC